MYASHYPFEHIMYRKEFLPLLKFHLQICKILQCVPFDFDQTSGRLVRCRSHLQIRMFKLQCALSAMYCTSLCLNLCFGPLTTLQKLQGLVFFIAYLTASIIRWNYSLDNDPIQLIHAFLDFEATIVSGESKVLRNFNYL